MPLWLVGFSLNLSRHVVLKIDDLGMSLAFRTHLAILTEGNLTLLPHLLQGGQGL